MNAMFRVRLQAEQWRLGPALVTGDIPDAMKTVDGQRVSLEVQLANSSRAAEDVLKFMALADAKAADVFVHIAFDKPTADLCADNVASGEHFIALARQAGWRYERVPTVALTMSQEGVARADAAPLEVKADEIAHGRNPGLADEMARLLLAGCKAEPGPRVSRPVQCDLF